MNKMQCQIEVGDVERSVPSRGSLSLGTVEGVDELGRPLVRVESAPARPHGVVHLSPRPDWARCCGLRVIVGDVAGAPFIVALADPARAVVESKPDLLKIESGRELVIECGKAKITLRADGRIEIRGGHIVSRSSGPNKVKGASVHLN